jgi:hypothetical protein
MSQRQIGRYDRVFGYSLAASPADTAIASSSCFKHTGGIAELAIEVGHTAHWRHKVSRTFEQGTQYACAMSGAAKIGQLKSQRQSIDRRPSIACQLAAALKSDRGNPTVVSKGNVKIFPSPPSRCLSSTRIPLSAKSMRRNCGRATPRSAHMLPTFPSIKPSGGYHDGCSVERIRIEISRPSASKSKAASSRELMFAQASFCASSVRYDAVSTRHPRAQPMKA